LAHRNRRDTETVGNQGKERALPARREMDSGERFRTLSRRQIARAIALSDKHLTHKRNPLDAMVRLSFAGFQKNWEHDTS
jgi:hypothetical protein